MLLLCLAIALHNVDGPIRCQTGKVVRLAGIGATELDGSSRPGQPGIPGDPFAQRRTMAEAIGGGIGQDNWRPRGYLRLARLVQLSCDVTGQSWKAKRALSFHPDHPVGADHWRRIEVWLQPELAMQSRKWRKSAR